MVTDALWIFGIALNGLSIRDLCYFRGETTVDRAVFYSQIKGNQIISYSIG